VTRSSALAAVLLATGLAGPLAAQPACPVRGEQPVAVTRFVLGAGLRGKVPAAAFEQEVSRSLSQALRCTNGLRFQEWLAEPAAGPVQAVLQVSMVLDGRPPGVPIRLVIQVMEGDRPLADLNLGAAAVLYGARDSQVPGTGGGSRWKADLEARFHDLAWNQKFVEDLVGAFSKVSPLVETEDLKISQSANLIGLPVSPGRLSAGPKTRVDLEFDLRSTPEEVRARNVPLWVTCLVRAQGWEDRLQLALVQNAAESGPSTSRGWPELSSELVRRIPGSTAAYLRSYEWQDPEVCGRFVRPRRPRP
jgi:hypothetical protein